MLIISKFFRLLTNFIFPSGCLLCGKHIPDRSSGLEICEECIKDFNFFNNSPKCTKCGIVFESGQGQDHLCSRCRNEKLFFDMARSMGPFDGTLRKAVHMLKYSRSPVIAPSLGKLLAHGGYGLINPGDYDAITAVPLHRKKLRHRGFNQSLLLARQAGKTWKVPVQAEWLARTVETPTQTNIPRRLRAGNVKNAFNCRTREIRGKKILIIDDVFTTGATVNECAKVLKRRGAAKVDVLTLARTL